MTSEAHAAAAWQLLSLASSKSQCSSTMLLETPDVQKGVRSISEPLVQHNIDSRGYNEGNSSTSPLIYVGVTLERPANNGSWGMTLFQQSQYLVVGGIQQEVMQRCTSWAWASTAIPDPQGDFRSSFGPLHYTSLLQLVPGDIILTINGQSQVDSTIWQEPRLNILAVRLETARRAAVELSRENVQHAEYQAAETAFAIMEPLLTRAKPCQRQLFPTPQNVDVAPRVEGTTRDVSANVTEGSRTGDSISPSVKSFPEWLAARKVTWRQSREKKRRRSGLGTSHLACAEDGTSVQAKRQRYSNNEPRGQVLSSMPLFVQYQDPVVFVSVQLVRVNSAVPWGINVSHHDKHFLGVGNVNDAVLSHTKWGWATAVPVSAALLNITDEQTARTIFQNSLPFYSSSSSGYLQSGDFIISVAGRPVSSFESLPDIASYMKHRNSLMLIAVRHRVASQAAQCALREGKSANEITNAAFRALVPILYRSPGAMAWMRPGHVPVRQKSAPPSVVYRNPLFTDDNGTCIIYEDEEDEDECRVAQFLSPIPSSSDSFPSWLKERKSKWREKWNIRAVDADSEWCNDDYSPSSVATDFWTLQGFETFGDWLASSTFRWKQSYSWNRKKRERIAKECEEVVHFPTHGCGRDSVAVNQAHHWLRVRKQQWRLLRRKRQRRLEEQVPSSSSTVACCAKEEGAKPDNSPARSVASSKPLVAAPVDPGFTALSPRSVVMPRQTSEEMRIIDALLEEEEKKQKALQERPPFEITFLFDAALGAPDDVVAHCLEYLPRPEHGKLLCISTATCAALKERDEVWRQLCPAHWVLPRRPRKRWHDFYLSKIYEEERASRKWADDFLNRASDILFKQDNLNQIEKMITQGEKRVDFNINYSSGVVCERNSLLNLAAIYSRTKVVRWLVETKGADIETADRGGFTPLLNAAWSGDRQLVRYLLSRGADRTKIGKFHFFKPVNRPGFKGLDAEGWARKKGHDQLADLIRLGL